MFILYLYGIYYSPFLGQFNVIFSKHNSTCPAILYRLQIRCRRFLFITLHFHCLSELNDAHLASIFGFFFCFFLWFLGICCKPCVENRLNVKSHLRWKRRIFKWKIFWVWSQFQSIEKFNKWNMPYCPDFQVKTLTGSIINSIKLIKSWFARFLNDFSRFFIDLWFVVNLHWRFFNQMYFFVWYQLLSN